MDISTEKQENISKQVEEEQHGENKINKITEKTQNNQRDSLSIENLLSSNEETFFRIKPPSTELIKEVIQKQLQLSTKRVTEKIKRKTFMSKKIFFLF